jgi:TRAP-type C4-dicarboxylate transport system substrate-binding protein
MRKLAIHALALAAGASLSFAAVAQDKRVELRLAHWLPPQHALIPMGFQPWAKSVEAASKGTIKTVMFPAQQLGKAPDHYDMARDGIADMTFVSPGYQAARFPLFAASELPFQASQPGPGSAALDAWYRKYAPSEMKDVKYCFAHMHIGTLHSKKPITDPAQIKGMKIRPANGTIAQTMTLLGASNVQVSAPEARDALEKGVADAITFPWASVQLFNLDKAVKFHADMRLYSATFVWLLNRGWYDRLSASQKKVIDDHCSNEWAGKVGTDWGNDEDSGKDRIEKIPGHTVVKFTPQQVEAWKKAVEPAYDQWIQNTGKGGVNAKAVLDEYRAELKKRNAAY